MIDDIYFSWQSNDSLPKLTVRTTDVKILEKYKTIIERNIFWFQSKEKIQYMIKCFPDIEMNMFISISQTMSNESIMEYEHHGKRNMLKIDQKSFSQLSKEYELLGIKRLIVAIDNRKPVLDFLNSI